MSFTDEEKKKGTGSTNVRPYSQIVLGYGTAFSTLLALGVSSAAVQALQRAVPDCEQSGWRYLTQALMVALPLCLKGKSPLKVNREHVPWVFTLSLFSTVYNLGLYAGSARLPLVDVIATLNTTVLITMVVIYRVFLKKSIMLVQIVAMVVCLLGILFMAQPSWIFGTRPFCTVSTNVESPIPCLVNDHIDKNITSNGIDMRGNHGNIMGSLYLVVGGLAAAVTYFIMVFRLKGVSVLIIAFWHGTSGAMLCFMASIYTENFVWSFTTKHLVLLLTHCVSASLEGVGTIAATAMIGGIKFTLVRTLEVAIFLCLQYTLMTSYLPGHQNWLEVLGAVLNTVGAFLPALLDLIIAVKDPDPTLNDFQLK